MKFSDGLFRFPIKVYDSLSLAKVALKEDRRIQNAISAEDIEDIETETPDWVRGWAKIPVEEIKAWTDIFSEGKTVKEVADEGFSETMIITKTLGNFECLWKMDRFEKEVDDFVDRYAKGIDQMVNEAFQEKAAKIQPKKKRLFG